MLPGTIGDRLFKVYAQREDLIKEQEFIDMFCNIYSTDMTSKLKLTFSMYKISF